MRIVVCVKQIKHVYARTGLDPEQYFIAPEDKICRVNPCDEIAVEEAVRIREKTRNGEVFLITLGPITAERDLRRCLSIGGDRLYHIDVPDDNQLDSWAKAKILAGAIKSLQCELVLCGKESLDRRNGMVGAYLGHFLDFPFVSSVVQCEMMNKGRVIRAHRAIGRGDREVIECPLPAVLTVETGLNDPRYPTLIRKLWSMQQPIRQIDNFDLYGNDGEIKVKTKVGDVSLPRPRPRPVSTPDSNLSAMERIKMLRGGGSSARTKKSERSEEKIIEGTVDKQTESFVSFLKKHQLL